MDRLLNDAAGQPDALPVLQHALMRMWSKKRPWEPLGLAEYEDQVRALQETGGDGERGMGAFINGHAHEVLTRLAPEDQPIAKRVFQTLTEWTDDGRAVRRATTLEDVEKRTRLPAVQVARVVKAFQGEGFLNVWKNPDETSDLVDLAHEAVARQWRELHDWMIEDARVRRTIRRVGEAARDWSEHRYNPAYLFRGLQLAEAETYLRDRRHLLDVKSEKFLRASGRRRVVNWILSPPVIGCAMLIIAAFGWLSWRNVQQAARATKEAEAARLSADRARQNEQIARLTEEGARLNAESNAALSARLASSENTLKPRVYVQIRTQEQRPLAQAVSARLTTAGFTVPGVQLVGVGPNSTQIRYFSTTDESVTKGIVGVLAAEHLNAKPVFVAGYEMSTKMRPGHFELWLAPAPAPASSPTSPRVASACTPNKKMFSPAPDNPQQRIELELSIECPLASVAKWTIALRTFTNGPVMRFGLEVDNGFREDGSIQTNALVQLPDDFTTKLATTIAGELDASQARATLAAASTARTFKSTIATQDDAAKALKNIVAVRIVP